MNSRKQGNGLLVVLIILTAIAFAVYSVSNVITGESRRNKKVAAYHEAKQAADSLIQSSMAELESRFNKSSRIRAASLLPGEGNRPLFISTEFLDAYSDESDSFVVIPEKTMYTSIAEFNTEDTEIIGNLVSDGELIIWNNLPTFRKNIEILAKATVDRPPVGKSTVRARQFLEVLDTYIFSYAIFYNMPMEIAPGKLMNVYGNVHVNGDAWFQSSDGLNFYDNITISGDLYHGRRNESGQASSNGSVKILNDSNQLVNMKKDSSWSGDARELFPKNWFQSTYQSADEVANLLWDGNLRTDVKTKNMIGLTDYIEDIDGNSGNGRQVLNSAYPIIQPLLTESDLAIPQVDDIDYTLEAEEKARARETFETQKYSYKAGLTIKVEPDGSIRYLSHEREPVSGDLVYGDDGKPKFIELPTPADVEIAVYKAYNGSGGDNTSQLHDLRQQSDLNIVELDIEKLTNSLHDDTERTKIWGNGIDENGNEKPTAEEWWNGVVYVEFPQENDSSDRYDNVNPAQSGWGLKLVNGETIPNPSFAYDVGIYGTSIATNQMMYVEGNYNADGNSATGSPTEPDDPENYAREGYEAPAALIADSVTFLSESWSDANSKEGLGNRTAANTEVSAAVMTGLIPSEKNKYSGGVENFPRFLENWSGKEIRIRGSMVALFESEVGTERWGKDGVYSAPERAWGFHEAYRNGFIPPGTPLIREYFASDFELLNQEDYDGRIQQISSAE